MLTISPEEGQEKPLKKGYPELDTKLNSMVRFKFWSVEEYRVTPSLQLLPIPLGTEAAAVLARVSFMSKIVFLSDRNPLTAKEFGVLNIHNWNFNH